MGDKSYEQLVREALSWQFSGWDFSPLHGRLIEGSAPWKYRSMAMSLFEGKECVMDMGTGGGELLSTMRPFPPTTVATEGYGPNVPVAGGKLGPLGVEVVQTYCDDNYVVPQRGEMPFREEAFDVIINRHESFRATEVLRVLKRGGAFLTQQVEGGLKRELNEFLGAPVAEAEWNLTIAEKQLMDAGFRIKDKGEAVTPALFKDIGAVICYLRIAEWQIPRFSVDKYDSRLRELDRHIRLNGGFEARNRLFYLLSVRP